MGGRSWQRRLPRAGLVGARRGHQTRLRAVDEAGRRGGLRRVLDCSTRPIFVRTRLRYLGRWICWPPRPSHAKALELLTRTSLVLVDAVRSRIPWPEIRLTYDNARIPEALIAAGATLRDKRMIDMGVRLLERLLWVETDGDHFSFTPVGGWQTGEVRPGFDQQPLEAAAMAEACYRAWTVTGNAVWRVRALRSAHWLMGHNDTGAVLYDASTGATCDGLKTDSVNENRGAESTLAGLAILQIAAACFDKSPTTATR